MSGAWTDGEGKSVNASGSGSRPNYVPQRISSKDQPYITPSMVLRQASKNSVVVDNININNVRSFKGAEELPISVGVHHSENSESAFEAKAGCCGTVAANFWTVATPESGARVIMAVATYVMLVFIFELHYFIPQDGGFALVLLWTSAVVCGQIMAVVGMPPLLGMLVAGIALKNLGDPVKNLPDEWAAGIRAFGLMNILMRGGLEMDMAAVRRCGMAVVRLTALPGISEALCVAGLAVYLFKMDFFLALAFGFILAAVSPAVVVGGMFDLQSRGYGVRQGIPSLVVAAASFDDVVAISGYSMFIGLASGGGGDHESNLLMDALHGPINIFGGIAFGALGALLLSLTKIWDTRGKRSLMMLIIGTAYTFAAKLAHFAGAGALACLVMAALSNQCWTRGVGGCFSSGRNPHAAHEVERDLCRVWQIGAEPLLFSVIGSALDFSKIDTATIPKSIGLICGAVVIRCTVAFFSTCSAGLTAKERLFIALAWMPKATVQAALGPAPLAMFLKAQAEHPSVEADVKVQHGLDILTTAVFSILITAPAGLLVIQWLGPAWLERVDLPDEPTSSKSSTPTERKLGSVVEGHAED